MVDAFNEAEEDEDEDDEEDDDGDAAATVLFAFCTSLDDVENTMDVTGIALSSLLTAFWYQLVLSASGTLIGFQPRLWSVG